MSLVKSTWEEDKKVLSPNILMKKNKYWIVDGIIIYSIIIKKSENDCNGKTLTKSIKDAGFECGLYIIKDLNTEETINSCFFNKYWYN